MSEMETLKELRRIAADFECSASAVPEGSAAGTSRPSPPMGSEPFRGWSGRPINRKQKPAGGRPTPRIRDRMIPVPAL